MLIITSLIKLLRLMLLQLGYTQSFAFAPCHPEVLRNLG